MANEGIKQYKDQLYQSLVRDLSEFEKNFLLISGGILAFSITFIKDVVNISSANFLPVLFISWSLIALSVGLIMYTFLKSAYTSDKLWNYIDEEVKRITGNNSSINLTVAQSEELKRSTLEIYQKSKTDLKNTRYASIFLFITGLAFFGYFVSTNLIAENAKNTSASSIISDSTNSVLNSFNILINDSAIILKKKK